MFDAISGIFSSVGGAISDFAGGAFASIDEAFRGGTLSPGFEAGTARRAGIGLGGIFTDIGTSFLTGQVEALSTGRPAPTGVRRPPQGAPSQPSQTLADQLARIRAGRLAFEGARAPSFQAQPQARDVDAASLGGLLGGLAGSALQEFLGPPTRVGRAVERLFGFEQGDDMARALPGGAMIPFDPVAPSGGRLFGATRNLNTGALSVRPIKEIQAVNPMTGRIHTWREKGRCLLWSDDLAGVKRVRRVARLAGRKR